MHVDVRQSHLAIDRPAAGLYWAAAPCWPHARGSNPISVHCTTYAPPSGAVTVETASCGVFLVVFLPDERCATNNPHGVHTFTYCRIKPAASLLPLARGSWQSSAGRLPFCLAVPLPVTWVVSCDTCYRAVSLTVHTASSVCGEHLTSRLQCADRCWSLMESLQQENEAWAIARVTLSLGFSDFYRREVKCMNMSIFGMGI